MMNLVFKVGGALVENSNMICDVQTHSSCETEPLSELSENKFHPVENSFGTKAAATFLLMPRLQIKRGAQR